MMIPKRQAVIAGILFTFISIVTAGVAQASERFFAGGGPGIVALLLDLKSLNAYLPGRGFAGDFTLGGSTVFVMSGGGGFIGNRLRIGGIGTERSWGVSLNDSRFGRAELSFKYDGFLIEWARGGISLGGMLGSGTLSLRLSQTLSGSFAEVITQPSSLELAREFFMVQPYVSLEFKLAAFIGLRMEVGFLFGLSLADWRLADGTTVPGGPLSTLGAPAFSIMLIFGG